MSEAGLITQTTAPLTVTTLTQQLRRCGLAEGQTVLVHLAMSKLGWVMGGPQTIIEALLAAVGPTGTLMMVTNSAANTDPSGWSNPPIPKEWWQTFRDNAPAYEPAKTPTRSMGVVPELFRTWPGVLRSGHPAFSLAAFGRNAAYLTADHSLDKEYGPDSPVGKLYELDGHVLLLGVGHANNTSLHHAEFLADFPGKTQASTGSAMLVDGKRQWVNYATQDADSDDFEQLGAAFDAAHKVTVNTIANADVRFFKQRAAVDFGVTWLEANRDFSDSTPSHTVS